MVYDKEWFDSLGIARIDFYKNLANHLSSKMMNFDVFYDNQETEFDFITFWNSDFSNALNTNRYSDYIAALFFHSFGKDRIAIVISGDTSDYYLKYINKKQESIEDLIKEIEIASVTLDRIFPKLDLNKSKEEILKQIEKLYPIQYNIERGKSQADFEFKEMGFFESKILSFDEFNSK